MKILKINWPLQIQCKYCWTVACWGGGGVLGLRSPPPPPGKKKKIVISLCLGQSLGQKERQFSVSLGHVWPCVFGVSVRGMEAFDWKVTRIEVHYTSSLHIDLKTLNKSKKILKINPELKCWPLQIQCIQSWTVAYWKGGGGGVLGLSPPPPAKKIISLCLGQNFGQIC